MKDLISVIVPVYNAEKYIERCINSILCQSYSNIQILIVDDGSTDNSLNKCLVLESKHDNIQVFSKKNAGAASARNLGVEKATGNYIAFVDADDYIEKDMYEMLYLSIKEFGAQIACCGRVKENAQGIFREELTLKDKICFDKVDALKHFFTFNGIEESICDKLISKEILANLTFKEGSVCEDILFSYQLISQTKKVCHIGAKPMYHYCFDNENSASSVYFCKKTKALLFYPKEIYLDVLQKYKNDNDIKMCAQSYYLKRLIDVFVSLSNDNGNLCEKDLAQSVVRDFYKNFLRIIFNNKIDFEKKKVAIVYALRLGKIVSAVSIFLRGAINGD